jgi:hypothetical protein
MGGDPRIPVYLDVAALPAGAGPLAWLVEEDDAAPHAATAMPMERFAITGTHAPGCACCAPRGPAAVGLGRLFLRRARGQVVPFTAVVVSARSAAGRAAVHAALVADVLVAARFRCAP